MLRATGGTRLVDERYVRRYRELYERHWWWRAREELLLKAISEIAPGRRPLEILDVGCGDGLFFEKLAQFGEVSGVETDPEAVSLRSPWAERIRIGPFDDTFEPGRRFDLVLLLDVLEHLPDPVACLRRALALLRPGGRLLVTVPAYRALWTRHDDLNRHLDRYTKRTLRRAADEAGAEVLKLRYFFAWVAPVKLLQHWVDRIFPATPAPPAVPSDWVNAALHRISRIEQRLLSARSAPFGSSLLAILGRLASHEVDAPENAGNPVP